MTLKKLESPEEVGQIAAKRTLRRLGARKVKTAKVPIVFENTVAGSLVGHIFEAVNGDSVYRGASYLAGKLNEKIAGDNINIVDDGTMLGGFGTSPFDSEGVASRKTVVVENGVLKSYLLNTYTAKKLGMQTTGNASRGLAGTPGIGPGNFFLKPGAKSLKEIIGDIKEGLFVTEFLGFGVNLVTGDFSRGASGLWIENGELTFPGGRDHGGRQPERHVLQHQRDRQRPGVSRRDCVADAAHRWDDGGGRVRRQWPVASSQ